MMRDSQDATPYEDRHRYRLQAGVRARRRARTAWVATGSVLTIAGLGVGLMVLSSFFRSGRAYGPSAPPRHLCRVGPDVDGPPRLHRQRGADADLQVNYRTGADAVDGPPRFHCQRGADAGMHVNYRAGADAVPPLNPRAGPHADTDFNHQVAPWPGSRGPAG